MIQEWIDKADQLYTAFVVMPTEYKVVVGIGVLVALAALKNIWGMLYPVRWTAASFLRISAFLMHPRKRKKKEQEERFRWFGATSSQSDITTKTKEIPPFNFATPAAATKAYDYYSRAPMVYDLSDDQIEFMSDAIEIYEIRGNGQLTIERKRRRVVALAVQMETIPSATTPEPELKSEPVMTPFIASEADVA